MKTLAVYGVKGGSGSTTLVAELALLWRQQGRTVLAIDLCQQNLLRLHFAMDPAEPDGWCARLLAGEDWTEAVWRCGERLLFVPYGKTSAWAVTGELDDPDWLGRQLSMLALPADALVLLDLPAGAVRARRQGLNAADSVLVTMPADSASCALLDAMADELIECGIVPQNVRFALNQFDPTRRIDRDVELLLRKRLGARLAPLPVQRDASVREAFAARQPLALYAPESQAADDLRQLQLWLSVQLAEMRPAR